jgi:hypothetical protein
VVQEACGSDWTEEMNSVWRQLLDDLTRYATQALTVSIRR